MIIDTKEESITLWRAKNITIAIFAVIVTVSIVFFNRDLVKYITIGVSSVAFLSFMWIIYMMDFTYFYFSDNGKKLVFRFYSMRIFYGKPRTIEITKDSFMKYELSMSFFNAKESLLLYQKTPKGVAKYPPIPLTLLNKRQKTELKRTLFALLNG